MDAVISGRVGKAVLLEGNSLTSFDVDDPGTRVPMQPSDFHLLFGDAPDLKFLEDTDADAVVKALEFEHVCACALDLTLISLDSELSTEVRTQAVSALEELLNDSGVLGHLENVLYAKPLSPSADIAGALECCEATHSRAVRVMLQFLKFHQPAIREVCLAWDEMLLDVFSDEERTRIQHVTLNKGFFRSLFLARSRNEIFLADLKAETERLCVGLNEMDAHISQIEATMFRILSSTFGMNSTSTSSPDEVGLATLELSLRQARATRKRIAAWLAELEDEIERRRPELAEANMEVKKGRFFERTISHAAAVILREEGGPLHVDEIYNRLRKGGFQFKGNNPAISIAVSLNRSRRFRKVAPGIFDLTIQDAAQEIAS